MNNIKVASVVAVLLGASAGWGQIVKPPPRVMVILDTSRSMLEPTNADAPLFMMNSVGGDFDSVTNPVCTNKFCTAKKVLNTVIPPFTNEAQIGLTSYYQFVLDVTKPDDQSTKCLYDVLAPAGQVRSFTSLIDFTGAGMATCPTGALDPACPANTRVDSFPDGLGGAGANLNTICKKPTSYTRPTVLPNTSAAACSNPANPNCYTLTKTAVAPGTPIDCTLNIAPSTLAFPVTFSTTQCPTAGSYTGLSIPQDTLTGYRQFVAVGTPNCGGPSEGPTTAPANPPVFSFTALPGTGTNPGEWQSTAGLTCRSGAACALYRSSATPTETTSGRAWYGFFDPGTFTPAPGFASGAGTVPANYPFSAGALGGAYVTPTSGLVGLVGGLPLTTNCYGGAVGTTTRYTSSGEGGTSGPVTLGGTFNINGTPSVLPGLALGARVEETPTRAGATYNCVPGWPCDVRLHADTIQVGAWGPGRTLFDPTLLNAPNERFVAGTTSASATGANTYQLRITNPVVTPSCPPIGTTGVNPTPAGTTWVSAAPVGCNTVGPCAFSAPTAGSATAPGCPATIQKFNNAAPPTSWSGVSPAGVCTFNGKSYSAPSNPTAFTAVKNQPTNTCAGPTVNVTGWSGYTGSATTAVGTVNANNPAVLTFSNVTGGPAQTSSPVYNVTAVPSGYAGGPTTADNDGSPVQLGPPPAGSPSDPTGGCPASAGTEVQVNNATLCGARGTPCTMAVVGPQVVSNNCGAAELNKPCYVCRYQPRVFTWSRPTYDCNYTVTRYDFTVDRTATTCDYQRPFWTTEQRAADTHTCEYRVGAERYDFTQPNSAWCEYFAVRSVINTPRPMYTYEYLTKGNEPIGRAESGSKPSNLCSSTWAVGNSFESDCPESISECTGLTPLTAAVTPAIPAGTTCRLRYGGNTGPTSGNAVVSSRNNGRYTNYLSATIPFPASLAANARACEGGSPGAPDSYKSPTANPAGFCMPSGSPATSVKKLISDYYDPAATNSLAALYPTAAPYSAAWNNTATKAQGFGAEQGVPAALTGALANRSLFVALPDEGQYDPTVQRGALEAATDKCILPSVTAPGPDGRLAGGACVADEPIAPYAGDFTPLYGSLRSTYDYLDARFDLDADKACRKYYIVLATDGLENTPKSYTVSGVDPNTSVQGLVSTFRNSGDPTRPSVDTFVIAMGSGAAGEPGLDNVAASGGTTQAYPATNLAQLQAALNAVFTTITQGTYSYSKPAIGTDGTRLYTGQHVRFSDTGDWAGIFTAYAVNPFDGTFGIAWEMGAKLNHPSHPARSIYAGLRKKSDSSLVVGPFTSGFGELADQLNDDLDPVAVGAGVTSSDIIDFLRDNGHNYVGSTKTRSSKLGPIQYSAPVVIGKSPFDPDYGGTTAAQKNNFSTFKSTIADTRPVRVVVAANDGMVHAAEEGSTDPNCTLLGEADPSCPSGREAWAFVPGSLTGRTTATGQRSLAESLHRVMLGAGWKKDYLDNTVSIADVCGDGSGRADNCAVSDWKTIGIVTQRNGGRGVAAIDMTNSAPSSTSKYLWDFEDNDLGLTYSVPAIGRIQHGSDQEFVAIFGGGANDPGNDSWSPTPSWENEGRRVFVVNAVTGNLVREFNKFDKGSSWDIDLANNVIARPAIYRRPGPNFSFINSAYISAGESLYAMRFAKADGSMQDDSSKWKPDELFDPSSLRNIDKATCGSPPCPTVVINRVIVDVPGSGATPPTYKLDPVSTLPIGPLNSSPTPVPPPVWNRTKLAPVLISSGAQMDLFVGTGDVMKPRSPDSLFQNGNYFYAVHDFNQQPKGPYNDGRALWVVKFPRIPDPTPPNLPAVPEDLYEQVVSEPAIISGCVIVLTYTTPDDGCNSEGVTKLYGFDPVSGALSSCLTYQAPSPYAGKQTPVIEDGPPGIPSDAVVINDNLYFATSASGLQRAPVKAPPKPGAVRSYRRIK